MAKDDIDPAAMMAKAEAETGLRDWGRPAFREALDRICEAASAEPHFSPDTYATFRTDILGLMNKRLRLYADRARYPEIARQEIVAPLVVVGLPRTGTTILHAVLAQDPAARAPLSWEVRDPSPPPRAQSFRADPRIAAADAHFAAVPINAKNRHLMGAELPEECISLSSLSFHYMGAWARYRLPGYMSWFAETDWGPGFEVHRHFLQHLQAFAARDFWVLKSPTHLFALDSLMDAYPDACIIFVHRDPAQVFASLADLIASHRVHSVVDREALGREVQDLWRGAMTKALAYRQSGAHGAQFIDILYTDFMADPLGTADRIYSHFGMRLSPEAEANMMRFVAENRPDKHGARVYAGRDYGLDPDSVHARFQDYIETYFVPVS